MRTVVQTPPLRAAGEYDPPFGPPTPARVITLIGPDKEYYLKGRRAENQGMGIGAFSYYRRVVENQKNRIIDEVITIRLTSDEYRAIGWCHCSHVFKNGQKLASLVVKPGDTLRLNAALASTN